MMPNQFQITQFMKAGENFLIELLAELKSLNLNLENFNCDHLCFRVGSINEYEFYKSALAPFGQLLTEALVNGRPIATYRLHIPYRINGREISLIELPAPKEGTNYQTGYEHAEFVITESFAEFSQRHPELQFKASGQKSINPELCLKLSAGKQVKFHHQSLDKVIELEEAAHARP